MRVLHWTESFWPRIGGAERFARLLAAEITRRAHHCLVVSDMAEGLPEHDTIDDIAVRRFPFQAALAQRDLRAIVELTQRATAAVHAFDPDVVHVHTNQPGAFFFLRVHKTGNVPAIYTTHDPVDAGASRNPLMAQLLTSMSRVVAISSFMAAQIAEAFPECAARIECIPNALPAPARAPTPLPWTPPTILALGRLTDVKGFDVLLRAVPALIPLVPEVRVVISGDGPQRPALEALALQLGLSDRVRFTGWVSSDQTDAAIRHATLLAVPSRWQEPFGLVGLEAMYCGRPVIASTVGGLPEVVQHEHTGLLVPADDADAWTDALARLLCNRELSERMGRDAATRAASLFDWARCVDRYEATYESIRR